jgi:hypothetical protein
MGRPLGERGGPPGGGGMGRPLGLMGGAGRGGGGLGPRSSGRRAGGAGRGGSGGAGRPEAAGRGGAGRGGAGSAGAGRRRPSSSVADRLVMRRRGGPAWGAGSGAGGLRGGSGLAASCLGGSGSAWAGRRRPCWSARRLTRSAWASSILEEWLFTPIPRALHSSRASLLVSPSSRASS